jgi:hypothetical protein
MKDTHVTSKPEVSSKSAQKELDNVEKQFEAFNENVKSLTLDRLNEAPKEEKDMQTKLSSKEMDKAKEIYLKPKRSLAPGVDPKTGKREEFNEKYREDWNFAKEYVQFIAEHKEILGEPISDLWTKPFPGVNAESWDVPVNKPVWGPRYLAERIKGCKYQRLTMQEHKIVSSDYMGSYTGQLVADTTVQRLDAHPVTQKRSVFMGASGF